ncbi:MAG TPA: hypothetical protein VFP05_06180 [Thermomicrobiales bacterium]|nr:hypothetical protein [Thermomicrobiales bacterium]
MNRPDRPIDADLFLASLRDRTADGVSTIALDGGELPVSVHLQETPNLVFTFSGAVDRNRHPLPCFSSTGLYKHIPASIIGLSDPSLAQSDEFRLAWYAGHEGFELQKILPDLVWRMIDCLGATRVAFTGASGGGFAALYYSWQIPGSIALVSNPQTNLDRAIKEHREKYRAICWPSLAERTPLDTAIDADLCPLYAKRCDNTVIYFQEATDFYHLRQHFAPFITAASRDYFARMIIRMEYWGRRGHHPAPPKIWVPWMHAALTAPDTSAVSIQETWTRERSLADRPSKPPVGGQNRNIRDDQIAAALARAATNTLLGEQSFQGARPEVTSPRAAVRSRQ